MAFISCTVWLQKYQIFYLCTTIRSIALVQVELANERESGDLFFTFDGAAVSAQSNQARDQLADIARRARECSAFQSVTWRLPIHSYLHFAERMV